MSVTFHIPGPLCSFADGKSKIEIPAAPTTVREALHALWALHPGIRDRVVTEQGEIREHINVFVGHKNIRYTGGLATALAAESDISIIPAVSGG